MKKYLLLFGLVALAACGGSRDDKSCNCYQQDFERTQRINPKGEIVSDTGWKPIGEKKDYSKNCNDNEKVLLRVNNGEKDSDGWETLKPIERRVVCQ